MPQIVSLLLLVFITALIAARLRIPQVPVLVIAGLALGFTHLLPRMTLNPETLMSILLPPLLFEGALHLEAVAVKREVWSISILAFAGTLIAAAISGLLFAVLMKLPFQYGMLFGALISATDPISVISIFRKLGAPARLTLIIEAESLFNDGMAAVIFLAVLGSTQSSHFNILQSIVTLLITGGGGALTGFLLGYLAAKVHSQLDDQLVNMLLTTILAYGSYEIANSLRFSGVMAVVIAGIVVGNKGLLHSMTTEEREGLLASWRFGAFVVNSVIFLLVGVQVVRLHWVGGLYGVVVGVASTQLGRAFIYPLCYIAGKAGECIPVRWQHLLFWGGLRGALAMALSLAIPSSIPCRGLIVSAAYGVVLFSLLIQGLSMEPVMRKLIPVSETEVVS